MNGWIEVSIPISALIGWRVGFISERGGKWIAQPIDGRPAKSVGSEYDARRYLSEGGRKGPQDCHRMEEVAA